MIRSKLGRGLIVGGSAIAMTAALGANVTLAQNADDETDIIIVQGTKQERELQRIDDSINVTTGEDIVDRNIVDLDDLLKRVANADSITSIRNLTPAVLPAPDSGAAPSVSVYFDNVRTVGFASAASGSQNIWDVEQVEVFRGPQSTRQGENTLAGAIIMRSTRPSHEFDAKARFIAAEYGERVASFAVGGSLVEDVLATRVSFDYQTEDGYISAPGIGVDDFRPRDTYVGRVGFLYTPKSMPEFDALLTLQGSWFDTTGSFGLVDNDDDPFDFENAANVLRLGDREEDEYRGSLEMNYELNEAVTLTSVTGYYDYSFDLATQDNALQNVFDENFTQELRAQFEFGAFEGIFGVYYANQTEGFEQVTPDNTALPGRSIPTAFLPVLFGSSINPAVLAFYPPLISFNSEQMTDIERTKYAVFGEVDWSATDSLTFTGGLRIDKEENETDVAGFLDIANLASFPDPTTLDPSLQASAALVNATLPALFNVGSGIAVSDDQSETVVLPRAGVRYDWSDTISTAFMAARGYRSGGVSIRNLGAEALVFEPESLWNYEVSVRSTWLDNRLTLNFNAFFIDWEDQQVLVQFSPSPFDAAIINAAESQVMGFEIESSFQVTDYFEGYLSLGYSDTEFDDFPGQCGGNCEGNEFSNAPPWSGAIGGVFRHPTGVFAQADISYRDQAFGEITNTESLGIFEERTVIDAQLGYEQDKWKLTVFGRNLSDEEVLVSEVTSFVSEPLAPRTYGVRLDLSY
ncbi:MAG: TonB-dependent receptor [Pseudomonadota bacterium]